MILEEVSERADPQRALDPAGRSAVEAGVEPRARHRLLQHRETVPGGRAGARLRTAADREVLTPIARQSDGALARSGASDQASEDLSQQAVPPPPPGLALDGRVQRLRSPDARAPAHLAAHEAGLLQTAQVRTERVRRQGPGRGEPTGRDRPAP